MKFSPLLLAGSLVGNAVLIGLLVTRAPQGPERVTVSPPAPDAPRAADNASASELEAALRTGDRAALLAAGVPADIVRALVVGRAFDRLQEKLAALRTEPSDQRYWRRSWRDDMMAERRTRLERNKAQRELLETVRDAYGRDMSDLMGGQDRRYSYLSAAKREQLRRIEQDYNEMTNDVYMDQDGIQLPSDREKLKLLREERDRDIKATMTPEERRQYDLHDSNAARMVMSRYGPALETEEQYLQLYAMRKALTDQFPSSEEQRTPEQMRAMRAAEEQFTRDVDALLTADQRSALQRANDNDYMMLGSLSRRLNLPATATDQVIALRGTYGAESMQIQRNGSLSDQDKRRQLQALATRAQNELQSTLGAEGAQAYAQRTEWLGILRGGGAFSTDPKDAPANSSSYRPIYRISERGRWRTIAPPHD